MPISIRSIFPTEVNLLEDFLYEAIFVPEGTAPPPRDVVRGGALLPYIEGFGERPGDLALCAEVDGAVVGMAWCRFMRGYGFVREDAPELAVSVLPPWRGRGVGTALLRALATRCELLGYSGLSLSVQRANPACKLYKRLGFTEVAGNNDEAAMFLLFSRAQDDDAAFCGGEGVPGVPFAIAREAALRVVRAPELRDVVYLEGGLVPWLISGRDSGRRHGDVDFSVRIGDMPAVRSWLTEVGLYEGELDSLNLECNAARADFGVHAVLNGVIVSFCPFEVCGGRLHQRNAVLMGFDGFDALFEAVADDVLEGDLIEERRFSDGNRAGCSTLEACRAAKIASGRVKDACDVAEIDRLGFEPQRFERLARAFETMRVDCVAYGA